MVVGGLLMSLIALRGALTLIMPGRLIERLLLPLVASAAGTLLDGAFFHLTPGGEPGGLSAGSRPLLHSCAFAPGLVLMGSLLAWFHA